MGDDITIKAPLTLSAFEDDNDEKRPSLSSHIVSSDTFTHSLPHIPQPTKDQPKKPRLSIVNSKQMPANDSFNFHVPPISYKEELQSHTHEVVSDVYIDLSSCLSPKNIKKNKRRRKKHKSKNKSRRRTSSKANNTKFDFRHADKQILKKKKSKRSNRSKSRPPNRKRKQKSERRNSAQTVIPSKLWLSHSFDVRSQRTSITLKKREIDDWNGGRSKSFDPGMKTPIISSSKSAYGNVPVPSGFKHRKRAKSSNFKFAIQTNEFDEFLIECDGKSYFVNSPTLGNNNNQNF